MAEIPTFAPETVIARDGEVLFREVDGEVVMLSVQSGKYYSLDPVGSRVWALLETPRRLGELCELLLAEYEVEPAQCEAEVVAFLQQLAAEPLIKTS